MLVTIKLYESYKKDVLPKHKKISHKPLFNQRPLPNMLNKIYDFIDFPKKLTKLCKQESIDKIIARGAPPGALAMKVSQKTGIPFYIESFEPHADYMYESGTWKKYDPRYIFQKKWEKQQLKKATALMPVAENYKKVLVEKSVNPEKIDVIPCCVYTEKFAFNKEAREKVIKQLGCNDKTVGIYTGKFGRLYYAEEAFSVFKTAFERFGEKFFLIILTPDDKEWIYNTAEKYGLPKESIFVTLAPYSKVAEYLSAADFAFSLQSPKPSNLYLSPIKTGEYWAAGLPILMTQGVGDDSKILQSENASALFRKSSDKFNIIENLLTIENLINEKGIRTRLAALAAKHRSFSVAEGVYGKWYGD